MWIAEFRESSNLRTHIALQFSWLEHVCLSIMKPYFPNSIFGENCEFFYIFYIKILWNKDDPKPFFSFEEKKSASWQSPWFVFFFLFRTKKKLFTTFRCGRNTNRLKKELFFWRRNKEKWIFLQLFKNAIWIAHFNKPSKKVFVWTSGEMPESTISNQSRLPAEFKHINKRRKRN